MLAEIGMEALKYSFQLLKVPFTKQAPFVVP